MNQLTSKFVFQLRFWFFFICLNFNLSTNAQTFINFESGALFTGINDIRNGNNGTLFSLKNDFSTPVSPFLRLRAGILLNGKNHFSFLYAPLKIVVNGTIEKNILFDGQIFNFNFIVNSLASLYGHHSISCDEIFPVPRKSPIPLKSFL